MSLKLPEWANDAINESCQSTAWRSLINKMQLHLKSSLIAQTDKQIQNSPNAPNSLSFSTQNNNGMKRFYEYNELEQAVLVEQELRQLQLQGDEGLLQYNEVLNAIIDDKLMKLIDNEASSKASNVQQLMTTCSRIIISALESSPPQLQSTAKLFINRPIPDDLRAFLWSSSLALSRRSLQMLPVERISPSLDVILSRRCHLLLDGHFRDISTRSSSALIKSVLVDFLKRNYLSLPSEEIIISSTLPTAHDNDYTFFDRLFFIAIVLCSVFPGPISLPTDKKSEEVDSNSTSVPIAKPQYMLSVALQALMEDRHLAMYSSQSSSQPRRTPPSSDELTSVDEVSRPHPHSISPHSPFLSYTRALVSRKNPELSEHILSLFSASSVHADILQTTSSLYVKSLPHVNAAQYTVITYFYDILINESLMRGLSGLLSLPVTQFVWDQCFIFGYNQFLPLVASTLILGCSSELLPLISGVTVVETFVSYCQHLSIESIQRLLSEYCKSELQDIFDISSTYALDYDELSDTKILQAVCRKLNPWEERPIIDPQSSMNSPIKIISNPLSKDGSTLSPEKVPQVEVKPTEGPAITQTTDKTAPLKEVTEHDLENSKQSSTEGEDQKVGDPSRSSETLQESEKDCQKSQQPSSSTAVEVTSSPPTTAKESEKVPVPSGKETEKDPQPTNSTPPSDPPEESKVTPPASRKNSHPGGPQSEKGMKGEGEETKGVM